MAENLSLILLRGLPGAGKSTLAEILSENGRYPVFSVDQYFTGEDGTYRFRFEENHLAYKQCAARAEEAMRESVPKIFLENTFTIEWEIETYFALAKQYGYKVFVVTVENRHGNKNTHDISEQQLEKMAQKFRVVLR